MQNIKKYLQYTYSLTLNRFLDLNADGNEFTDVINGFLAISVTFCKEEDRPDWLEY